MATKYTKDLLEDAVNDSFSYAGVLRYLGLKQAGGTQAHIAKQIKLFNIDTSHFTRQAHNKGKRSPQRKTAKDILIVLPEGSLRAKRTQLERAMLESNVDYVCASDGCGVRSTWNGKPITLEINHINGDWLNNTLENLEFLCPNCHSQQESSNMPHKYRRRHV